MHCRPHPLILHNLLTSHLAFSWFTLIIVVLVVALGHLEMYQWCPHFTTGFTFATVGQYLTGTTSHFFFSFFSFPTSSLRRLCFSLRRVKIERFLLPFVHSYLKEQNSSKTQKYFHFVLYFKVFGLEGGLQLR